MPSHPDQPDPGVPPPSPPPERLDIESAPEALAVRRSHVSLVWLIPLVALAVAAWLAVKTYSEQGPEVRIGFKSAAGLEAGKTKVKFKDVDVGEVTAIDVSPDLKSVVVTARLKAGSEHYLTAKTRFWVERPRVTASRVSGLETLLSGAYIAIDPVTEGESARDFVGLEEPPLFTTSEPGKRFLLHSSTLGSLNVGSPVYYRQIQVGQVVGNRLDDTGGAVTIEIFVSAPHDRLVHKGTRFWSASGLHFSLSADGLKVDTESLLSMLIGGVSFDTLDTIDGSSPLADSGESFPLYISRDEAHERIYQRKERYLMLFKGSARGLSVGAPVLMRGITVGKVLDVQLTFDTEAFDFQIPVLVELEPERVGIRGDRAGIEGDDLMDRLVERGLRGQLQQSSLLTGQLFVDLDFHPDASKEPISRYGDYRVLPTVGAPLEGLATKGSDVLDRANSILTKVDALPIERIGDQVDQAAAAANRVISSDSLKGAIAETEAALAEVRKTAERLDREIAPRLSDALTSTTRTMNYAGNLVAESSPTYIELERMFQEVSATARSLRLLSDYLERHPEALLKGKGAAR